MNKNKNILIKNIYYMLTYAFRVLNESNYEEIEKEEFDNIYNLLSSILTKGIGQLLKRGLHKEYIDLIISEPTIRGKIKIEESIYNIINKKQFITCEYDELSENNLLNQIIKTTILLLIRCPEVKLEFKNTLKRDILFFKDVEDIDPRFINWERLVFQKNNLNYRMIISLCQLIIEGMLLTTEKGELKLASYIDDKSMHSLYEAFILEFYKKEYPQLKAASSHVSWALDDEVGTYLPSMITDVTLSDEKTVLIIDAKYYSKNMQMSFNAPKIHSSNLYQIFAYVKNKQLETDNKKSVAGMILYAKTESDIQPDSVYNMSGNKISVKTLDLNKDFPEIRKQLDKIVEDHFKI